MSIKTEESSYRVYINSKIEPGYLVYSDKLIKGKSKKVLLSTYLHHPQMANMNFLDLWHGQYFIEL